MYFKKHAKVRLKQYNSKRKCKHKMEKKRKPTDPSKMLGK